MNHDKFWRIKEAIRHLELALIGSMGKSREEINFAIDELAKFEEEYRKDKND